MLKMTNYMSSKRCSFCRGTGTDSILKETFTCYACQGTGYIKSEPVNLMLVTCGTQPFEKAKD